MLIQKTEQHKLDIEDQAGVRRLLEEALSDTDFKSFNVYTSKEWPPTGRPKLVFNVSVGTEYKDATDK